MTPARLNSLLGHLAVLLIVLGLVVSVYGHAHAVGMVISLAGFVSYGGSLVALYLAWDRGDV